MTNSIIRDFTDNWAEEMKSNTILANSQRVSVEVELDQLVETRVNPEDLQIGDILSSHGYIAKIDQIFSSYDERTEKICYVMKCAYIAGDLDMFNYFLESINNGCDQGYRSHEQGNDRATWFKVEKYSIK